MRLIRGVDSCDDCNVVAVHRIVAERAGVALQVNLPDEPVRVIGSDRALADTRYSDIHDARARFDGAPCDEAR